MASFLAGPICLPLLMVIGCNAGPSAAPTEPPPDLLSYEVQETGPYAAGYLTLSTRYVDPLGSERELDVAVWYPAQAEEGTSPVYSKLFADKDVFEGAPLALPARSAGYPVLVHSHGYRGYPGNSADLMRHFASHGWVVVAPAHRNNTLLDSVDPLPLEHFFHRPLDMRQALDAAAEEPFFSAGLDLQSVMVSGHSFGTYTTWALAGASYDVERMTKECQAMGKLAEQSCSEASLAVFEAGLSDTRVRAALPMAGGWRSAFFGEQGHASVKVPVLFMTGTADSVDGQALFDAVSSDLNFRWLSIEGGCHQLFGYGDCPEIGNEEGFALVNAYALALGRRYVLNDDQARVVELLDGEKKLSPKAVMQKK